MPTNTLFCKSAVIDQTKALLIPEMAYVLGERRISPLLWTDTFCVMPLLKSDSVDCVHMLVVVPLACEDMNIKVSNVNVFNDRKPFISIPFISFNRYWDSLISTQHIGGWDA